MSLSQRILLVSVAIFSAIAGSLIYRYYSQPKAPTLEEVRAELEQEAPNMVGLQRPDYRLGNSQGEWVSAKDFDGQVVLVNFWATWCVPCRKEMPMLLALHQEFAASGLQVVGIALDEVDQARQFAAELGIAFPILVGSVDVMQVVRDYGNIAGVLPYSVLLDRDGIIRWTYLGELEEPELREELAKLLPQGV